MKSVFAILVFLMMLLLPACTASAPQEAVPAAAETNPQEVVPPSTTASQPGDQAAVEDPVPVDSADPSGLVYVREEEKLAHDVYLFLFDRWGLQVFENIASSELSHTEAVRTLLASYGLEDPAADAAAGVFTNPELQGLYDQLTARGSQSLAEALKVGATIEEIDILDLQARLSAGLPDDVRLAYENLLSGSYNHLSAFTSTLTRQTGEVYAPQFLTAEAYQQALSLSSIGGSGNGYHGGQP
jgi:hypothetical protein